MKSLLSCLLVLGVSLPPLGAADYQSEFFKKTQLVYADSFDAGLNTEFWEVRQNTTWSIKEGVLFGSPSPKEFQEMKKASGDPSHAGFKPVIWLKKVPENFVCTMRLRYDGEAYGKGSPLVDLGHHIHTLSFSEKATTLTLKKNVEKVSVESPLFTLNAWHDVVIELTQGKILLSIDGRKHLFESSHIDKVGQAQIDFKALDFGTCQIDDVKVWQGLK